MNRLLPRLACLFFLVTCARDPDETKPQGAACLAQLDRQSCDQADACIWVQHDKDARCVAKPDDCRLTGCTDGLRCAPLFRQCVEGCTQGEEVCCFPIHRCQNLPPPEDSGCDGDVCPEDERSQTI